MEHPRMTEELKPCPFCGSTDLTFCVDNSVGDTYLFSEKTTSMQGYSHFVSCKVCNCRGRDLLNMFNFDDDSMIKMLVALWNTRA